MKLPLSDRLLLCAGFVAPGDRVADIGCDHGYLAIHLLKNGIARSVIAADINEGPLQSARRNAEKFGVGQQVEFCLSDGVTKIPRDFDVMVCAGMGGDTMISILEAAPWLKSGQYRLILQCQSKVHYLRRYLSENGWHINEETVLRDGRFLYTVMEVVYRPEDPMSLGQCYFPPALLKNPDTDLPEYYKQVVFRLNRAVTGQKENADPEMVQALAELEKLAKVPEFAWLNA